MMGKVWRLLLLALLLNASLATITLARTVYLADGGVIQAQKVWKEEGRIYVLLNRDSLIHFSPEEINLKKTFAQKTRKAAPKSAPQAIVATAPAVTAPAPATAAVAPAAAVKPAPAAAVPAATGKPAPPPAATPGSAPAKVPPAGRVSAPPPATPAPTATAPAATVKPTPVPAAGTPPKVAPAAKVGTPAAPVAPAAAKPVPAAVAKKPAPKPRPAAAPAPPAKGPEMMAFVVLGGGLLFLLLLLASFWKVFTKAGEAGWKSLIPIYNYFVLLQIAGCPGWWLLMFFIPVVNLYFLVVMHIRLAEKFGKGPLFGFALCFLGFIFFPILAFGPASYYGGEEEFSFDEG